MKRLEDLTEAALRYISTLSLIALFGLILMNVGTRTFNLGGVAWFDEIVRGSFSYMVFFGAAALWIRHDHFQVDWLELTLPDGKARWALRSIIAILCAGFLGVMTWYGWILFNKANALTPILQIPEKGFYAAIPISGAVMFLHTLASFIGDTKQTISTRGSSK
jgi:TRAP-type C4-dicarboxylate transport system permease small subunit